MDKNDKGPIVMIVDDIPENLELLADMLQSQGYQVLQFPNGALALSATDRIKPDLILLDIMMPKMDGFEVCQRLKAVERLKEIPVIFISALDDVDNKIEAFSKGGVDYVTKPFQEKEVISRVHTHLELERQKREIRRLLSETLIGSIKALNELLAKSCPKLFQRTLKIVQYVRTFYTGANLENGWMFEVAANLLNLGSLVTSSHKETYEEMTARLAINPLGPKGNIYKEIANVVRCIPRLDMPAAMIENTTVLPKATNHWRKWPDDVLGGHILAIASGFESRLENGYLEKEALLHMFKLKGQFYFHKELLSDFGQIVFNVTVD